MTTMRLNDLSGELTRQAYFVLRKAEFVMTAFESILTASGLPDAAHQHIIRLKHGEVDRLEQKALRSLLHAIVKGHFDERYLLGLPPMVLAIILDKLARCGIPHPLIMRKILKHDTPGTRKVNLTGSHSIPAALPILLHCIKANELTHLTLDNNVFLRDNMLRPISGMKTLQNLSLAGCTGLTNNLFHQLKGLPCLRRLSVARITRLNSTGISYLWNGSTPPIEHLDLSSTSMEEKAQCNIFKVLLAFTKLTSLVIASIKTLGHLEGIEQLQNLKRLVIRSLSLSPQAIEDRVSKLTLLEYLDMHSIRINPPTSACIQSIFALPLLKSLDISMELTIERSVGVAPQVSQIQSINMTTLSLANNNWVTDRVLLGVIGSLNGLLELELSNTRITSQCLSQELPRLPQLLALGLQGILLHDDDMLFLTHLPNLKRINIADTSIGDHLLMEGFLNSCKNLELVSLCRTSITDKGLADMNLKRLKTLWLDGCAVSVEAALSMSVCNCKNISYLSMQKLAAVTVEEEILAADVVDPD